jgi:methyl-accepting chemotaxis protein
MLFSKSIRARLILAFLVPVILIIILGFLSYNNTSGKVVDMAAQASKTSIESSGKYLGTVLRAISDQANQICADTDVQQYFTKQWTVGSIEDSLLKSQTADKVSAKLTSAPSFNSNILSTMIISNNESASSFFSTYTYKDLQELPYMKAMDQGGTTGVWLGYHREIDEMSNKDPGNYSLTYLKPVRDLRTGRMAAVLIVDVRPEMISEFVNDIDLGENQQLYVISSDGRVNFNASAVEDSDIVQQQFFRDILGKSEVTGTDSFDYSGTSYLTTYYKIGDTGLVLLGMIPESELNSAARNVIVFTVLIVLAAVVIAFGTGIVIANSMSRTISQIIKASEKAASGDLTVRLKSLRKDELGKLTLSINSMIASMRALIEKTFSVSEKVTSSAFEVSSTSGHVSAISADISRAIQEIAQGASEQATDSENGVEKIKELADKINIVSENARMIEDLTKSTMEITGVGLTSINDLNSKANETTVISKEIVRDILELDKQSKSIGTIVKVISKIADQTNLLSLNAAIEAERAGEMGKGFSVVADEVRRLAAQSMDATQQIAFIIKNTQNMTSKTVEKAAATEAALSSQNNAVQETIGIFRQILKSMENLNGKVEQINRMIMEMEENKEQAINSIQNISAVSQETAASSQEVTASTQEQLASIEDLAAKAEELKNDADDLQQSIMQFKLD